MWKKRSLAACFLTYLLALGMDSVAVQASESEPVRGAVRVHASKHQISRDARSAHRTIHELSEQPQKRSLPGGYLPPPTFYLPPLPESEASSSDAQSQQNQLSRLHLPPPSLTVKLEQPPLLLDGTEIQASSQRDDTELAYVKNGIYGPSQLVSSPDTLQRLPGYFPPLLEDVTAFMEPKPPEDYLPPSNTNEARSYKPESVGNESSTTLNETVTAFTTGEDSPPPTAQTQEATFSLQDSFSPPSNAYATLALPLANQTKTSVTLGEEDLIPARRQESEGGPSLEYLPPKNPTITSPGGQYLSPSSPIGVEGDYQSSSAAYGSYTDRNGPQPLVIYFEDLHYKNKARELGFCEMFCSNPSNLIGVKAGKCPPIIPGKYRGDCQDQCKYDSECPGGKRCCNNGCANICLDPTFRKTCADIECAEGYACVDDREKIKDAICVNTTDKVGRCPAESLWDPKKRSCEDECIYDFQCPADERCCYNGCANVCTVPDLRLRCEDHNCEEGYACIDDGINDAKCVSTAPKNGRCPKWTPGQYKKCGEDECTYDSQCPDGQKCCDNGCSNVCVDPDLRKLCEDITCPEGTACIENPDGDAQCFDTTPKGGLCPRLKNDTQPRGGCEDTCTYDSQCAEDSKCCFNGCAFVCLRPRKPDCDQIKCKVGYKCSEDRYGNPICSPIPCKQDGEIVDIECNSCTCIQGFLLCAQEECPPVKAGFCPRLTQGYKGKCVEDCSGDYDCKGEDKCCSTGCGHTCQKPVDEIVHPCKTVRFRCGDITRCAATRGLCQPGKTCPLSPLCISRSAPWCDSCPPGKVCVLQKQRCPGGGGCHRQPICIQLYSDDTVFEEDKEIESQVVAKQTSGKRG